MSLLYYAKERATYGDQYCDRLTDEQTEVLFNKLRKHYKFGQRLRLLGRTKNCCSNWEIRLHRCTNNNSPSIGILAHEVAHALQLKQWHGMRNNKRWHCKRHTVLMERVLAYLAKHRVEWLAAHQLKQDRHNTTWQNQMKRQQEQVVYKRTTQYKLETLQSRHKRALARVKRAKTILTGVERKIKYYEAKVGVQPQSLNSPTI